jgi:hypothetical protein
VTCNFVSESALFEVRILSQRVSKVLYDLLVKAHPGKGISGVAKA